MQISDPEDGGSGMPAETLRGAVVALPAEFNAATFDQAHGKAGTSPLMWRLSAQAYGENYPAEVQPWGMTTWWVLGRFVSELKVGPGHRLVDLACGRGGPGLWLARATGADLTGVDWSAIGVAAAQERASEFVPDGRADFRVGELAATGLPDGYADAAMCADAIFFAADRVAAFTEVARILKPAGRFVFTCDEDDSPDRAMAVPDWTPLAEAGGLEVERKEEVPHFAEQLQRMYDLWLENLEALRAEVGDDEAQELYNEAMRVGPTLKNRRPLVITARKPT
jgi:ubiquinone/menaquinone biosynthesis C-methylase UbiE